MRSPLHVLSAVALALLTGLAPAQEPPLEVYLQIGHTGDVTSVALSGDGKRLLTGARDGTAILWEAAGGKQLHTFQHADDVTSVALSGDGGRALTGSNDGTTVLWESATGKKAPDPEGAEGGAGGRPSQRGTHRGSPRRRPRGLERRRQTSS